MYGAAVVNAVGDLWLSNIGGATAYTHLNNAKT
jgi:hypothetical protein